MEPTHVLDVFNADIEAGNRLQCDHLADFLLKLATSAGFLDCSGCVMCDARILHQPLFGPTLGTRLG